MRASGQTIVRKLLVSATGLLLLAGVAANSGCRVWAYFMGEDETKKVTAEYAHLVNQKVCLLVRAEPETLFDYPQVQFEVADHIRVPLESNVKGCSVVEPRKVVEMQRRSNEWERTDPAEVGKRLGADRLVEITLTQYSTREPESPHLFRGYISALIRVYNTAYVNCEPTYKTEVKTVYPPDSPGEYGAGDRAIRRAMMEAFAEEVAGKFYDRTVKVK